MTASLTPPESQGSSTRPYLIRALHDWCTDNGFTPYLAVHVAAGVQVPMEYVKNNEIVLNVGFEATSGLKLGNEFGEFKARFGGVGREASPMPSDTPSTAGPVDELASGAPTPAPARPPRGLRLASTEGHAAETDQPTPVPDAPGADDDEPSPPSGPTPSRPSLKRVK